MMHVLEMPFQIIFYAQEPKPVASIAVSAMTLPRPQHSQEQGPVWLLVVLVAQKF